MGPDEPSFCWERLWQVVNSIPIQTGSWKTDFPNDQSPKIPGGASLCQERMENRPFHTSERFDKITNHIIPMFKPNLAFIMFCKIQVKILVNGEERISPWANYVLQPPRENQVILHIFCVRVICTIFKGFEGTAFAQHMWTPPADVKHKLSHPRPTKPSSLRWPELDSFGIPYEIPKFR